MRKTRNLVRNSDAKVPTTIKLIDAEEVNAFALPGGFFFVHSGLVMRRERIGIGRLESGRVTGISPQHPPTPPDVRFSASGG
jgi:hypothetical protein